MLSMPRTYNWPVDQGAGRQLFRAAKRLHRDDEHRQELKEKARNWRFNAPAEYVAWVDSRKRLHRWVLATIVLPRPWLTFCRCPCGRTEINFLWQQPWEYQCYGCRDFDNWQIELQQTIEDAIYAAGSRGSETTEEDE